MTSPLLFLSHSGADTEAALALAVRIEDSPEARKLGLKVWVDKRDMRAGTDWKLEIQNALDRSTGFAVYIGSKGVLNWVWDEVSVAIDRTHSEPFYPLIPVLAAGSKVEDLPGLLSRFQGVRNVENDAEAFVQLIRGVLRTSPQRFDAETEPFQGLEAFDSARAHLFFGRETEVAEVVELLRSQHLVIVMGDSGSGKSSLVKAGVIPQFRGGALADRGGVRRDETVWQVFETRPLGNPFEKLAEAIRESAQQRGLEPKACSDLADLVRTGDPARVKDAVQMAAPSGAKVFLVVDQFEELFTLADAASQIPFAQTIVALANEIDDRIRIVLTMRLDYYHLCSDVPILYGRLEANDRRARYILRRMSHQGLRQCVTEPLRLASIPAVERDELAKTVLRDVEERPNDLALLEMALSHAWARRHEHGGNLTRAYVAIGRVDGALATAAERAYTQLSESEQALVEPLLVRLVKVGDLGMVTRRVANRQETRRPPTNDLPLGHNTRARHPSTRWQLAQKFATKDFGRLLIVAGDAVEVAHEALVRSWPRYLSWLRDDKGKGDLRGDDKRQFGIGS